MRSCCAVSGFTCALVGGLAVTPAGVVAANAFAAHSRAAQPSIGISFIASSPSIAVLIDGGPLSPAAHAL
jgi:hypothetical protein